MPISKKEFIEEIVEKVLNKLLDEKGKFVGHINKDLKKLDYDRNLITSQEIKYAVTNGFNEICISSKTIITPLVNDLVKEHKIKITIRKEESECCKNIDKVSKNTIIAVLSNFYDEAYKIKTKEYLLNLGIESECLTPKNFTTIELQNSLDKLVEKLLQGYYHSAIVISSESYSLKKRIENNNNLKSNICWEIDGLKNCSIKSKILFVNANLIGFKKLEKKMNTWIDFNKN